MKKFTFTNDNVAKIFESKECGFEGYYDLMSDLAQGKVCYNSNGEEVSKEKANNELRKVMYAVLGVEEGTKGTKLLQAMRRHKLDVFEVTETILEDMLKTGWGENPFFNEFVEIKNADDDETNEFYSETSAVLTVSELAGGHHNLYRQRLPEGKVFTIPTSWWGVKIYAEFLRFIAGKVDWAKFIQEVYKAFDKKVNSLLYAALNSVGDQLPAGGQWVKNIPLTSETKATFDELIEDVKTANGSDVTLMGTRTALGKLVNLDNVNWISEQAKNDRYTMGRLGFYEGVRLAEIPQVFADNDTTTKLVDDARILVMPNLDNKFIKMFNEGLAQIKEISDGTTNTDMTMEYEYQRKMGVGVVIGRLFGIVNITANVSG
jgi:hypothetical protein